MITTLEGRRVLVTGAAANIGRAIALRVAADGARLALVDRCSLDETLAELGDAEATGLTADLSREQDVRQVIARAEAALGGLDVIVNNAGIQRSAATEELSLEDWQSQLAVNAGSCFLMGKHGLPALRRGRDGVVVNMASLAALRPGPGLAGYAASKAAIVALTKVMALEAAADNIRVNALCPGWVDTSFNAPAIAFMGGREAVDAAIAGAVPLGRQGRAEEIAEAALFLASGRSSYMTGQALVVDGGVY
jgi:NAD(P)-dependent dehydrogenase (short-subunit alcohol dehydrogenase family)